MTRGEGEPLVSIGLPVFNGERYLAEAIQSILDQSHRNLELIICDNASTDGTAEICRHFAARDGRVRYFRNEQNLGAVRNFNLAAERATGSFFKWAAADDRIAPEFCAKCVEALQSDPSVVLCQGQMKVIDEHGNEVMDFDYAAGHAGSELPSLRLRDVLSHDRFDFEIFGLIRASALRQAGEMGSYVASDRVMRARLALLGSYRMLPEPLFFNRDHPNRSVRAYPAHHLRGAWFDPRLANKTLFPHWRVLYEYARSVNWAPISASQRIRCYGRLVQWVAKDMNWARLGTDVVIAIYPGSWRLLERLARSRENWLRPQGQDGR